MLEPRHVFGAYTLSSERKQHFSALHLQFMVN